MWYEADYGWQKLAADVKTLATEAYEDLMGFDTSYSIMGEAERQDLKGHKPMRDDIAKLKKLYELKQEATTQTNWEPENPDQPEDHWNPIDVPPKPEAKALWDQMTQMNPAEKEILEDYTRANVADDFDGTVQWYEENYPGLHDDWNGMSVHEDYQTDAQNWKDVLKTAIRKQQTAAAPARYLAIANSLDDLRKRFPGSYKLWPWLVKQIKSGNADGVGAGHIVDVIGPVGEKVNELRRDHKLPADFDINQLTLKGLEDWWMDWKRENRASEAQGEVVYTFHDGWTIQRLNDDEQLQFEGDEMGHCVGDYAYPVMEGKTNIYSLRDPKGNPHVTMEIEGRPLGWNNGKDDNGVGWMAPEEVDPDTKYKLHKGVSSTLAEDPDERDANWEDFGGNFEIVQIQGNSNLTPKPEYQRKIKEFLDYLKQNYGVKFSRSSEWYHNYDDPDRDRAEEETDNVARLDDMHTSFINDPAGWVGGHEDVYGLEKQRRYVNGPGLDEWVKQAVDSFFYRNDLREKYSWGEFDDPVGIAEQLYYYASLGNFNTNQVKEAMDDGYKQLQSLVNHAQEQPAWDEWAPPYEPDDEDWDEETYHEALAAAEDEYMPGAKDAREFLEYLDTLFGTHGVPHPKGLPTKPLPRMHHLGDEAPRITAGIPESFQPIPGAFG